MQFKNHMSLHISQPMVYTLILDAIRTFSNKKEKNMKNKACSVNFSNGMLSLMEDHLNRKISHDLIMRRFTENEKK